MLQRMQKILTTKPSSKAQKPKDAREQLYKHQQQQNECSDSTKNNSEARFVDESQEQREYLYQRRQEIEAQKALKNQK